jgi:hypothetical protein
VYVLNSVAVNEEIDDSHFQVPNESAAAAGTPTWKGKLLSGLYPGIKLWKPAKTSFSMNIIKDPGTVLVMQKNGLSGTKAGEGFAANIVTDGVISQKGSAVNMLLGGGANRRDFKAGDKFYFTAFALKEQQISFDLVSISTFDVTTNGTTKAERYAAQLQFTFPDGYLAAAEPATVQAALDAVIMPEEMVKSAQPATVELGQTFEQVEKALGKPSRVVNLGAKAMWIYSDMKVVFLDGKVSDVQ